MKHNIKNKKNKKNIKYAYKILNKEGDELLNRIMFIKNVNEIYITPKNIYDLTMNYF